MTSRERARLHVQLPNAECFRLNDPMFGAEMQGNDIANLIFNSQTAHNGLPVARGCYITNKWLTQHPHSLSAQTHADTASASSVNRDPGRVAYRDTRITSD
jgi:hypothetical protein